MKSNYAFIVFHLEHSHIHTLTDFCPSSPFRGRAAVFTQFYRFSSNFSKLRFSCAVHTVSSFSISKKQLFLCTFSHQNFYFHLSRRTVLAAILSPGVNDRTEDERNQTKKLFSFIFDSIIRRNSKIEIYRCAFCLEISLSRIGGGVDGFDLSSG